MRMGIRAAVAASLLALFYGLLGGVTWFGVMIVRRALTDSAYAGDQRVITGIFGMFFLVPAIRVLVAAIRKRPPSRRGVAVDRAGQPRLWQFVESLAEACRVAAPTRIVVTGEVLLERVAAVRKIAQEPGIVIPAGQAIELLHAPDGLARAVADADTPKATARRR